MELGFAMSSLRRRRRKIYDDMLPSKQPKEDPPEELEDETILDEPEDAPEKSAKGVCSKCGEYIGKGIYFHEKACTG